MNYEMGYYPLNCSFSRFFFVLGNRYHGIRPGQFVDQCCLALWTSGITTWPPLYDQYSVAGYKENWGAAFLEGMILVKFFYYAILIQSTLCRSTIYINATCPINVASGRRPLFKNHMNLYQWTCFDRENLVLNLLWWWIL